MITDAAVIANVRLLYPAITVAAASDPYLTACVAEARAYAGETLGDYQLIGLTHVTAHFAIRGDPAGVLGVGDLLRAGPISSHSTLNLSVGYANPSPRSGDALEAEFQLTGAGRRFLALLRTRARIMAAQVY